MTWDQINVDWQQLSARLKENWSRLTDQELTGIAGKREQLIRSLHLRYGYPKQRAEIDIDRFIRHLTPEDAHKESATK
jgi:uncharacterized protein YjbJ (UPF0337 family)